MYYLPVSNDSQSGTWPWITPWASFALKNLNILIVHQNQIKFQWFLKLYLTGFHQMQDGSLNLSSLTLENIFSTSIVIQSINKLSTIDSLDIFHGIYDTKKLNIELDLNIKFL